MNRNDAIEFLKRQGYGAFKQDGELGLTVGCGVPSENFEDNCSYKYLLYLFQTRSGWGIDAPSILPFVDYSQSLSLLEVCELAVRLLRCEHLPIAPEHLRVSHLQIARVGSTSRVGSTTVLEHLPTGVNRILEDGGVVLKRKHQALMEIILELANQTKE